MSTLRVEYDFDGEAESELTVRSGDVVVAAGPPQDDWILVHKMGAPDDKGYVPVGYLSEMNQAPAPRSAEPSEASVKKSLPPTPAVNSVQQQAPVQRNPAPVAQEPMNASHVSHMSTSGIQNQSYSASRPMDASFSASSSKPFGGTTVPDTGFADAYARHEAYFKQVMQTREEKFRKLEQSVATTANEITRCQEKNEALSQKIRDLDNLIDEERRKWKEKLENERANLLMKSSSIQQ